MDENYFDRLKRLMDKYAHLIYRLTRKFPKGERFGIVSQLRRAALSVVLNFIEGFARRKQQVKKNFWETSYGSLKESKYLLHFSLVEGYMTKDEYKEALELAEEIGAMLWNAIESIKTE